MKDSVQKCRLRLPATCPSFFLGKKNIQIDFDWHDVYLNELPVFGLQFAALHQQVSHYPHYEPKGERISESNPFSCSSVCLSGASINTCMACSTTLKPSRCLLVNFRNHVHTNRIFIAIFSGYPRVSIPGAAATPQPRLQSRLHGVFILQLTLISVLTVAGVLAASVIAERVLVKTALSGEATYFWNKRANAENFALPDTLNLQSYISSDLTTELPPEFEDLPPGQHKVRVDGDQRIVYVSTRDDETLYLLFQSDTVSNLAFYFGILPLALVLLLMYSLAYLTYVLSKRAISPLTRLASSIENYDFTARELSELPLVDLAEKQDTETLILADALNQFVERSKMFVERERDFTRYASHELRTPLAVIQGSVSTLELQPLSGAPERAVARIKRNAIHMSALLETLLLLARDGSPDTQVSEHCNVNKLLDGLTAQLPELESGKPITIELDSAYQLYVNAPEAALVIVLGNLLRNAWHYTDAGEIRVLIDEGSVSISDTGPGLNLEQQQHIFDPFYRIESQGQSHVGMGLGLAIVRQTCESRNWDITLVSQSGQGSTFKIQFGDSVVKN